jgi:hypothetical protein
MSLRNLSCNIYKLLSVYLLCKEGRCYNLIYKCVVSDARGQMNNTLDVKLGSVSATPLFLSPSKMDRYENTGEIDNVSFRS